MLLIEIINMLFINLPNANESELPKMTSLMDEVMAHLESLPVTFRIVVA